MNYTVESPNPRHPAVAESMLKSHHAVQKKRVRLNSLIASQNGRHFADDNFKFNVFNEKFSISMETFLKFVPKRPINKPALVKFFFWEKFALVKAMAWRPTDVKPLPEPVMMQFKQEPSHYLNRCWPSLMTHIRHTGPEWVNSHSTRRSHWKPRHPR